MDWQISAMYKSRRGPWFPRLKLISAKWINAQRKRPRSDDSSNPNVCTCTHPGGVLCPEMQDIWQHGEKPTPTHISTSFANDVDMAELDREADPEPMDISVSEE